MRGQIAEMWHAGNVADKLNMLVKARDEGIPLDTEMLDEERETLDGLALRLGMVGIYVATVDAAGQSCRTPAVIGEAFVGNRPTRKLRP